MKHMNCQFIRLIWIINSYVYYQTDKLADIKKKPTSFVVASQHSPQRYPRAANNHRDLTTHRRLRSKLPRSSQGLCFSDPYFFLHLFMCTNCSMKFLSVIFCRWRFPKGFLLMGRWIELDACCRTLVLLLLRLVILRFMCLISPRNMGVSVTLIWG